MVVGRRRRRCRRVVPDRRRTCRVDASARAGRGTTPPSSEGRPRVRRTSALASAWASSRSATASGEPAGGREVEVLVGAVGVGVGAEHAGDHELGVGEPFAEHAHERDRAALAEQPGRLPERRRRGRGRAPPRATVRAAVRSSRAPARPRGRATRAPYGGSAAGRPASLGRAAAGSAVGGIRNDSLSDVRGRSTLPARAVGGRPVGADHAERRLARSGPAAARPGRRWSGRRRRRTDSGRRSRRSRPRSPRPAPGDRRGSRRRTASSSTSPVGLVLDPVDSSGRAIRNDDGTMPDTSPECSPSVTMSTVSVALDQPAQRRGDPHPVVVDAARVEADDEARGADPVGERLDVGRRDRASRTPRSPRSARRSGRARRRRRGPPRSR